MKPDALKQVIDTPGDLASYMLRRFHYHGSAYIPQPLIDLFGGHLRGVGTYTGETAGIEFQIVGSYTEGSQAYNASGTLAVNNFGLRLSDLNGDRYYWVDYQPGGDSIHNDMHYHEPDWSRNQRVYASKESVRFWQYISRWQSPGFTSFLEKNEGNENCLYDLDGGC